MDLKEIAGWLAILLTFGGYVRYVPDVLHKKTKPHLYTWLVWSLLGGIVFALQLSYGAGMGAYITLSGTSMCVLIFILSLRNGVAYITKMDTFFLSMALLALGVWLFAKQPVFSVILATSTGVIGFAPTALKAWRAPHSETLSFYLINIARFLLGLSALASYNIVTLFDPLVFLALNASFAILLIARRQALHK